VSAPLRLASRRSPLALAQAAQVAGWLAEHGHASVVVEVTSHGDTTTAPLSQIGGTGVFVSAVRAAVLAGDADLAVHSAKDLPTAPADGLVLAAVPPRSDPRDVLVAAADLADLVDLPPGASVGTGSPRRAAQLRAARADLVVVDVRGNVGSRLALVDTGRLDAVVLARAGLLRLGLAQRAERVLDVALMLPAPGQGCLAVECRVDDARLRALLAGLDDPASHAALAAERGLLAGLGAGCTTPVGALATVGEPAFADPQMFLQAVVDTDSGLLRMSITGAVHDADGLGRTLADRLLARGAGPRQEAKVP